MDKSWIDMPRNTTEYLDGLDKFLDFAFEKRSVDGVIRCPCPKCRCKKWESRDVVRDHLICKEFPKNYKVWIWHGETYETITSRDTQVTLEPLQNENPVLDMINDVFGVKRNCDAEPTSSPEPSEFGDAIPTNLTVFMKNLFHFQTLELFAKRYCLLIMGRKYRNGKLKLWNSKYDPSYSRGYLIANVPDGVPKDQWSSFVDYHLKQEYQELCQRNSEARKKQTIPHTGGSKLLSRRQYEMEMELGREVSRGEMYIATHKKSNGSYVNEDARSVGVLVEQELSQTLDFSEVSKNDALAKVLGPDHSGCVRGLGVGALHSVAFRSTTTQMKNSISSAESTQLNEELNSLKTKLAASDENIKTLQTVLFAYMQMKEGHIAANLAALFGNFTKMDQGNEEANPTQQGESSLDSNYV